MKSSANLHIIRVGTFSHPVLTSFQTAGIEWKRIAARSLLRNFDLKDKEKFLPILQVYEFLNQLESITGKEDMRRLIGMSKQHIPGADLEKILEMGDYGRQIMTQRNLFGLLENSIRMEGMLSTHFKMKLETFGDRTRFSYRFLDPPHEARKHFHSIHLRHVISGIRIFAGHDWLPLEIQLADPVIRLEDIALPAGDYPVTYGHHDNAVLFPTHLLHLENPVAVVTGASSNLQGLPESLTERIDLLLLNYEPGRMASLVEFAEYFNMSERNLRRKLLEEGTTFSAIRERYAYVHSLKLLSQPDTTVKDIAEATGYNDAANFIRFFRKKTGVSPSRYREMAFG